MNKKTKEASPWDNSPESIIESATTESESAPAKETTKPRKEPKKVESESEPLFDLEGLMTDFPTAKELEQFVYDRTGIVLNLKGRSNKFKYQTAMDVLNGAEPDPSLIGNENPYLSKADLVPVDPIKSEFPKDPSIAGFGPEVNVFDTNLFPHPDPELKAQNQNCQVRFAKYANGAITYEILGPITQRAIGERINKYGQRVPEKFVWVDPRTGEQVIVRGDGTLTPLGTKIRAFMRRQRMNNSNMWDVWIDRDFIVKDEFVTDNPWAV
jgi:hypothetical protein